MKVLNWLYRLFDKDRQAVVDKFDQINGNPPQLDSLLISPVKEKMLRRADKYTEQMEYDNDDQEYDDSEYN